MNHATKKHHRRLANTIGILHVPPSCTHQIILQQIVTFLYQAEGSTVILSMPLGKVLIHFAKGMAAADGRFDGLLWLTNIQRKSLLNYTAVGLHEA